MCRRHTARRIAGAHGRPQSPPVAHTDPAWAARFIGHHPNRIGTASASGFAIDAEIGKLITEIFPNALESGLAQIYAAIAQFGQDRDLGEVEYGDNRATPAIFAVRAFKLKQDFVCDGLKQQRPQARRSNPAREDCPR
jgi:hypothetical protein